MPQQIQFRRGNNADRQQVIFAEGEPVYTTDTKKLFIGDGTTQGGIDFTDSLGLGNAAFLDESEINHTNIQNVGTNTHTQIDNHISDNSKHFLEGNINHDNINNNGNNTHTDLDNALEAFVKVLPWQYTYDWSVLPADSSFPWIRTQISGSESVSGGVLTCGASSGKNSYEKFTDEVTSSDTVIFTHRCKINSGTDKVYLCNLHDGSRIVRLTIDSNGAYYTNSGSAFVQISAVDTSQYHDYTVVKDNESNMYVFIDGEFIIKVESPSLLTTSSSTFSWGALGTVTVEMSSQYLKFNVIKESSMELVGTRLNVDNIQIDGNEITSNTGIISLVSNTLQTEGGIKTNILELGNCINYAINGYLGDTSGNKWFEIATITLNNQYEGCSVKGYIATGAATIDSLDFEFKLKQDNPLGQEPITSFKFIRHSVDASLKSIITQNDATATIAKLYAYCKNDYSTIFYRFLTDSYKCVNTKAIIEGLGSGTEITPSNYFSNLNVDNIGISTGNLEIGSVVRIKSDGSYIHKSDTTTNRPSTPTIGQEYFDTTLSKPIWWDGSDWKDAAGNIV